MEIASFKGSLRRSSRKKRGNIDGSENMKIVRLGGGVPQRAWRIKVAPKLRLKMGGLKPLNLWKKVKNGYMNMMLHLAGNVGQMNNNNGNGFGAKRVPTARQLPRSYSTAEFDDRLVTEIYKSLVASRELATT